MKLGEILTHRKGSVTIDDSKVYKLCRVQLHRKGVVLRESILGEKIKTKKQQVCKRGDFIVAEMDAKVGGYGFIPDELDGAIVSSHYFLFELNEEKVDRGYFSILVKFGFFQSQIKAVGSTNYAAVRPSDVLNWEVPVPSLKEQEQIRNRTEEVVNDKDILVSELTTQLSLLSALRQSILTEAVQGKLTAQWRHDNPNQEHAGELLKRIAAEKARLIKEKKISKEKPLPPIKAEEMPYEVPEGWVWCYMQDLCPNISSGSTPPNQYWRDSGIPYLKVYNIRNQKIDFGYKEQYIDLEYHTTKSKRSILKPGDVIMNIVGPPLGKVAIIPDTFDEWNCNQAISFFKPIVKALNEWIYSFLCEGSFLKDIELIGTAGQDNISVTKCKNIKLPIPPIVEQHAIVQKVNTLLAYCDELEQQVQQSKADLDLLMQAVLGEVFETERQV